MIKFDIKIILKKQYFFSFVLATLSFIAAKSLQKVGVENYYYEKASTFSKEDGYFDLLNPNNISMLPMGIESFSSISFLDSTILICLQEESGSLVLLDSYSNKVLSPLNLNLPDKIIDFSSIDSTIILVDDKMQVHFLSSPYDSSSIESTTDILSDWKSAATCVHESTKRLFILSESNLDSENPINNSVYTYSLAKRKLSEKSLFDISVSEIELFAMENNISIPEKVINQLDTAFELIFNPCAIAVHPKTNEIYVLSAKNRSIVIYNQFGEIINLVFLDEKQFSNPTAMTFHSSGDILISNSDLMSPAIVRCKWNRLFLKNPGSNLLLSR